MRPLPEARIVGSAREVPPPRQALTGSRTYARIESRTALKYLRRYLDEAGPTLADEAQVAAVLAERHLALACAGGAAIDPCSVA